jgi:hypothetical protein
LAFWRHKQGGVVDNGLVRNKNATGMEGRILWKSIEHFSVFKNSFLNIILSVIDSFDIVPLSFRETIYPEVL